MKISKIQVVTNFFAFLPAAILISRILQGKLTANPIQAATILTGRTAIYLLLISLYCSPFFNITKMSIFFPIRKTTGLFAFYYSFAHFSIFSVVDYQLNIAWIKPEIQQKPFLQIGLIAFIILIPLAVTSIHPIKKKVGKWWKRIHRLVYLLTSLILIHISLASKGDIIDPITLISIFLIAMLLRIPFIQKLRLPEIPKWVSDLNTFLIK
jgi:methionine sulfoxide reductase heme-binding subunit